MLTVNTYRLFCRLLLTTIYKQLKQGQVNDRHAGREIANHYHGTA